MSPLHLIHPASLVSHLLHPASLVSHLFHLHDDRLEDRSGHEGGVLLPLLPPRPVLVVCNTADQHVVVLPVAVDALHNGVQLRVVGQDAVLVGELLPQLVVKGDTTTCSNGTKVEYRSATKSWVFLP